MNGNSPAAQDYGQACDDAANRALTYMEKLTPREQLEAAIEFATTGGVNANDLINDLIQRVTETHEFGEGALKAGF